MNHETPKLRVVGDAAKSAERLREKLVKALGIIDAARREDGMAQAEGKPGTAWRYLSAAVGALRSLLRPEPGTIAWHTEIDYYLNHEPHLRWDASGEYRTPKDALDFVMANPPLNIPPAAEPIDPNAPKMLQGEKPPFTRCTLVNIPEIGIEFHQFYTEEYYHAVCYFHNKEGNQHVYEVTVRPFPNGEGEIGRWHANCMADGATKFILESKSKSIAIECALTAMRRYLVRGHRAAWRTARRVAKQQAYNSKAAEPLSPEEELADTIKRQKEEVQA